MNIKNLISHPGWRELCSYIEKDVAEVEKEILDKAKNPFENEKKLLELSHKADAYTYLLSLPDYIIQENQELEEEEED